MNFDGRVVRTISFGGRGNAFANFMLVALHELASSGMWWSSASLLLMMIFTSLLCI